MRLVSRLLTVASLLAAPTPALAQSPACVEGGRRSVGLSIDGDRSAAPGAVSAELERQVRVLLSAELAHRGVDLCDPGFGGTSVGTVAAVTLVATELGVDGPAVVDVIIDDNVTHKRVERSIDLRRLPVNGRALSIAVGVDELLGASWAELASLAKPRSEALPVRRAPIALSRPSAAVVRRFDLNGWFAMLADPVGKPRFGGDIGARGWLLPRLGVGIRVGYRGVRTALSAHGSVAFDNTLGALDLTWAVSRRQAPAGLEIGAASELLHLSWEGRPTQGSVGHAGAFWLLVPTLRLGGWASVSSRWRVTSAVSVGFPLSRATALDGTSDVPMSEAPLVTLALGLTWQAS